MCCRFPNRGVQNGQAAGRRTRAHRCRHRGRVCGHAGSARADGVKNKPWFVVGLDFRNTVRKQLSCGSCLSERGRCFFNIGTKFLQSFVFIKCGDGKAGPTLSRPRNLATKCAVRASLGWALIAWPFFWPGFGPNFGPKLPRRNWSTARLYQQATTPNEARMRLFVTPSTPSQAHYLYFIKDSLAALLCIALAMKNWLVEVCGLLAQIKYCQSEGEINPLGHCGNVYHS